MFLSLSACVPLQLWQLTGSKERVSEVFHVRSAVCEHCCLLLELYMGGTAVNTPTAAAALGVLVSLAHCFIKNSPGAVHHGVHRGTDFTAAECSEPKMLGLPDALRERILACANKVLRRCAGKEELTCQASVVVHNMALLSGRRSPVLNASFFDDSKILVYSSQEAVQPRELMAEE